MKLLLQLEMLGLFFLSMFLFAQLEFPWWWFPVLFLAPDVGMVGYFISNRVGAWTYNFTHHAAVSAVLIIAGMAFTQPLLELAGIIMLGHYSLDRVFGYGLKYTDCFKHTHLGQLK